MAEPTKFHHIVNTSGGLASWYTAELVAREVLADKIILLFADTFIETDDTYRFLIESSAHVLGITQEKVRPLCWRALCLPPLSAITDRKEALRELARKTMTSLPNLQWITEGRTPWEVFYDEKFIGNSRVDLCSRILKRDFLDRWMDENCDPDNTIQYFGLDANEDHRFQRLQERRAGWTIRAPLIEHGVFKEFIFEQARNINLRPSRSYALGYPHDNCSGTCVKGGQAQWKLTLLKRPQVFAYAEQEERRCMTAIGRDDIGVLRDRRGGRTKRISLAAFRQRIEANQPVDRLDWGGCGCGA